MNTSIYVVLLIIGCALVTWIPRILPFTIVKNRKMPKWFLRWLAYIPVCILSALVFESFIANDNIIRLDFLSILAFIPTVFVAVWTKSLSLTVIVGVITMAVLRFI